MLKISKDLFDLLYPVGTYYETSNANWTPSNAGWYGTWVEDTAGKATVAKDTGTFKTLGGSVGAETKTTNNCTLTTDQIPSHNHTMNAAGGHIHKTDHGESIAVGKWLWEANASTYAAGDHQNGYRIRAMGSAGSHTHTINNTGGGNAHNHGTLNVIQPSIIVRRWHRTA